MLTGSGCAIFTYVGDGERDHRYVRGPGLESLFGGGVGGAIHSATGFRLAHTGGAVGPWESGDALATVAFDLDPSVRRTIYTVGSAWGGVGHGEADVLASCYRRSP